MSVASEVNVGSIETASPLRFWLEPKHFACRSVASTRSRSKGAVVGMEDHTRLHTLGKAKQSATLIDVDLSSAMVYRALSSHQPEVGVRGSGLLASLSWFFRRLYIFLTVTRPNCTRLVAVQSGRCSVHLAACTCMRPVSGPLELELERVASMSMTAMAEHSLVL